MRKLLLCPPDFYGMKYENQSVDGRTRNVLPALAQRNGCGCEDLHPSGPNRVGRPHAKLPDMVSLRMRTSVGKKFIQQ